MQTILTIDIKGKEKLHKVPVGWAILDREHATPQKGDKYFSEDAVAFVAVDADNTAVPAWRPVIRSLKKARVGEVLTDLRAQAFIEI